MKTIQQWRNDTSVHFDIWSVKNVLVHTYQTDQIFFNITGNVVFSPERKTIRKKKRCNSTSEEIDNSHKSQWSGRFRSSFTFQPEPIVSLLQSSISFVNKKDRLSTAKLNQRFKLNKII